MSHTKDVPISLLFRQTLIKIALQALRALRWLGRMVRAVLIFLTRPFGWIFSGVFRLILIPAYAGYKRVRRTISYHPRFVGIRSFGHFFKRYALYLAIVGIGVFGVTQNILARTVRPDEVGQHALWTSFSNDGAEEIVVETGAPKSAQAAMVAAVGGTGVTNVEGEATTTTPPIASSDTLAVVGSLDQTTTDTPRETVETYTVQGGDTISTIAEQFGISSRTILWANGLSDTDFIKPGQSLKIPSASGYLYTVKSGDTLSSIVKKYGGQEDQILAANNLPVADAIQPGQDIIIPGGQPPAPPAPIAVAQPTRSVIGLIIGTNPPPSAPPSNTKFVWPTTTHRISQYYRGRRHTGLDIDGNTGDPIYAAADGRVIFAASDRSGYGLHIMIDHGGGFVTLYGHTSKIYVQRGDTVRQGQTIALEGCTGRCSGPHLHYEIRVNGSFVNPFSYY